MTRRSPCEQFLVIPEPRPTSAEPANRNLRNLCNLRILNDSGQSESGQSNGTNLQSTGDRFGGSTRDP
jgi:hypothetical protein